MEIFSWFVNDRMGMKLKTGWSPNVSGKLLPLPCTNLVTSNEPAFSEEALALFKKEQKIDNLIQEAAILSQKYSLDVVEEVLEAEFGEYNKEILHKAYNLLRSHYEDSK